MHRPEQHLVGEVENEPDDEAEEEEDELFPRPSEDANPLVWLGSSPISVKNSFLEH